MHSISHSSTRCPKALAPLYLAMLYGCTGAARQRLLHRKGTRACPMMPGGMPPPPLPSYCANRRLDLPVSIARHACELLSRHRPLDSDSQSTPLLERPAAPSPPLDIHPALRPLLLGTRLEACATSCDIHTSTVSKPAVSAGALVHNIGQRRMLTQHAPSRSGSRLRCSSYQFDDACKTLITCGAVGCEPRHGRGVGAWGTACLG